jgi:hypothetical protein
MIVQTKLLPWSDLAMALLGILLAHAVVPQLSAILSQVVACAHEAQRLDKLGQAVDMKHHRLLDLVL